MGQVRYACESGIFKGRLGCGVGQNGCESGISDGRRDKGRVKSVAVGMIKTRYGLLKARQPYEVTVKTDVRVQETTVLL